MRGTSGRSVARRELLQFRSGIPPPHRDGKTRSQSRRMIDIGSGIMRLPQTLFIVVALALPGYPLQDKAAPSALDAEAKSFIDDFCLKCHSEEKTKTKLDVSFALLA